VINQRDPDLLLVSESDDSLFQRHGRTLFAYVRMQTNAREDARDLTLETFKIALEHDNLVSLSQGEQLTWLRSVAQRKIIDRYRRTVRHPSVDLEAVSGLLLEDDANGPEAITLQREAHAQLHQAIQQLPTVQQQLLRLRYGDQLSFADIARLLNKREEALRKMLSRTLARLRKIYDTTKGE
jgi:RNA polymerase sigma factor (sigma-70 family)